MGKFSKIKKYNLKSLSIDEKIKFLDKEMEKTGLNEVAANSTAGVYVATPTTPNQNFINFNGLSHGGYGLGLSGGDGNNAGNGTIGIIPSPQANAGLDGVALSPPHPITGVRKAARHIKDGVGFSTPLRPGVGVRRGFGDNAQIDVMGGALWFFDSNYNFAGQQGRWLNFEWFRGGWGFWDTNFLGFYFHNKNLDEYELNGVNVGTQIKNKIAGINFGETGSIGTADTIVLTQNKLDDPSFLPINIDGLSDTGYEYLKKKAKENQEDLDDAARSAYFKAGGQMAWNYLDPEQKEYWRNKVGKGDTNTNIPDTSDTDLQLGNEGEGNNKFAQFITQGLKGLNKVLDKITDNPIAKVLENSLPSKIIADTITDTIFGVDDSSSYNGQLALQLFNNVITGNNAQIKLTPKGKKNMFDSIDAEALADGLQIRPPSETTHENAIRPNGKKENVLTGGWEAQGGSEFSYDPETGLLTVHSNKMLRKMDGDIVNSKGKTVNFEDIPNPTSEQIKSVVPEKVLKNFFELTTNVPGVKAGFSKDKAIKMMMDGYPEIIKALYNFAVEGTASNAVQLRKELLKKGLTKQTQSEKEGEGFGGYTYSQESMPINKLKPEVRDIILKKLNQQNTQSSNTNEKNNVKLAGGKLLRESAKLGHFEPEALTVDIKKLRKGILPVFPKKEPPKMIDGYSEKSQLAPKKAEREPFIKITKKDLLKNHKLKDSEIKEFMDTFKMINDFIKKHPEELIYAQQRYPVNDKRLAQLNWKMDQMMNASKEYVDTQFPENQRLVDRIKKATKKTMELTNPEAYKNLNKPDMELMSLDDHMKQKRVVSRHFKKKRQSKSMFRVDMNKVKEKNRKVAEQKVAEWQEKRRIELLNSNEFEDQKYDWRKEIGEDFANSTQGMKVGQTFTHVPSGQSVTTSGILGGIETLQTSVELFGDAIPGPDASQYGLQGFAKPIDIMRRSNKKTEQLNKELDSSEQYTKEIKADEFMKARLEEMENELEKLKKILDEKTKVYEDLQKRIKYLDKMFDKNYKKYEKIRMEGIKKISKKYDERMVVRNKMVAKFEASFPSLTYTITGSMQILDKADSDRYYATQDRFYKSVDAKWKSMTKQIEAERKAFDDQMAKLYSSMVYKYRQESFVLSLRELPTAKAQYEKALKNHSDKFLEYNELNQHENMIKGLVDEVVGMVSSYFRRHLGGGIPLPVEMTLRYAMGNMDPMTNSPGTLFNALTMPAIVNAYKTGSMSVIDKDYGGLDEQIARAMLNKFDFQITPNGIRVMDTFNFDDPETGGANIGAFSDVPGAQWIAIQLVKAGDRKARSRGLDPRDNRFGIKVDYTIPKSDMTPEQIKLFYGKSKASTNRTGYGYDTKGKLDSSGYGMDPNRDTETQARPIKPSKTVNKIKGLAGEKARKELSLDQPIVSPKKKKS